MHAPSSTALGLSIALHVAIGAYLWTRPPPPLPRPVRRSERVSFELRAPAPAPAPANVPRPTEPERAPRRPPPIAERRPPAEAPTPPAPPSPLAPEPEPARAAPAPSPSEELARPVDLFAAGSLRGAGVITPAPSREGPLALLPGEAAGAEARTEAERITSRIEGATVDEAARARVQAGLVDPLYSRLGMAFRDAWDPERALPETSAELWAKRRAQSAAIGMRTYAATSARFGATGNPMPAEASLDAQPVPLRDPGSPSASLDAAKLRDTFRAYMKGKFDEGQTALVLVTEAPGQPPKVELVRASGDSDVDRAAVDDLRRASARLAAQSPVRSPRRSLWSLRLQVIVNYSPVALFTFDEVMPSSSKLVLPLGRMLLKRIQLEAVYDDAGVPAAKVADGPLPPAAR